MTIEHLKIETRARSFPARDLLAFAVLAAVGFVLARLTGLA